MTSERQSRRARAHRVRARRRLRSDAPWIFILLLTSGFQFFRGAAADGAVFVAAGAAVALDGFGLLPAARATRKPRRAVVVSMGVIVVALLTLLPRYSVADGVIVAGIGIGFIPYAWPDPGRAEPRDPNPAGDHAIRRAAVLWSCLGIALCLWEVTAFFLGLPSPAAEYAHPPLSDLIGPLLDDPIGRAVCVALWLLGGAALLRRGRLR